MSSEKSKAPAVDVSATAGASADADENTLSQEVIAKYQSAAEIANRALAKVVEAAVEGARIIDLCELGDQTILQGTKSAYAKKKDMRKGIAFPTCVSPDSVICHLSPTSSDAEATPALKASDTVRVELGVHIDGYIAQAAHTFVVGATPDAPVTGLKADVLAAAHYSAEAALRLLKPGKSNWDVTDAIAKVAADFGCTPVQGMMTHQLQRNVLDGNKRIILNPSEKQRKDTESITFEEGEVYALDILISTGDGIPRPLETHRTTIFKKVPQASYSLKAASARNAFGIIRKEFGDMAFSLRQFKQFDLSEAKARLGLQECQNHGLITPYQVYYEKEDKEIAHLIMTVLILPTGPQKVTGAAWVPQVVKSEKSVQNESVKELLQQPIKISAKSKK
ncbi:peptidase M24, structural domain-containing protein [Zopfochytrium polystomum]|nr:peptidase M24, structural domain-containing protein [Zopfochytrium polystomum]